MSARYSIGNVKKLLATAALSAGVWMAAESTAHAEAPPREAPVSAARQAPRAVVTASTTRAARPSAASTAVTAATAPAVEAQKCLVGNTKGPKYVDCTAARAARRP